MKNFNQKGFTLIELLVVIGILAILLAITLIAINPSRQFQQANNTKRSSDTNAILNAIGQYSADNAGALPGDDPAVPANNEITAVAQDVADTGADICTDLVPTYISALPSDPTAVNGGADIDATGCGAAYNTEYQVSVANNRVTVTAPNTQLGIPIITVSR